MIRRAPSSNKQEEAILNLTPLLDVIFVILVMFMLIAPLLKIEQVELAQGHSHLSMPEQSTTKSPIQIHVRQDNSVVINQQPVELKKLKVVLKSLHSSHPSAKPLVFHDKRASFGTYQDLKTSLEDAGFDEMQIVLKPS